jgi:sphinganine-1-phosphate aldolase
MLNISVMLIGKTRLFCFLWFLSAYLFFNLICRTGGMYTTASIAGSRSGGLIAQTWASMMTIGVEGYLRYTKGIMETASKLAEGIRKIDGLKLVGEVDAFVVCFTTDDKSGLNVYCIGDKMHAKGWSLNSLQNPSSVHICVTVAHSGHENEFLQDLEISVMEVKKNPSEKTSNATIYGLTSSLPPGPVNELLKTYNDVVLKT